MTLRQRPVVLYTTYGPLHRLQMEHYLETDTRDVTLKMIALTPLSCGELVFSTCSHKSDFSVFDSYLSMCVYLLAVCLHALYSLHSTSLRNLGRVFKGGSSNYVKVGSLNHLNLLTALLPPHMSCICTCQCGLVVLSKRDLRSHFC